MHFGLGALPISEVRVSWPHGIEQRLHVSGLNKVHVVSRPASKVQNATLTYKDKHLVVQSLTRAQEYHWDLDGDFRTDTVTTQPRLVFDPGSESRSVVVRMYRGDLARRCISPCRRNRHGMRALARPRR